MSLRSKSWIWMCCFHEMKLAPMVDAGTQCACERELNMTVRVGLAAKCGVYSDHGSRASQCWCKSISVMWCWQLLQNTKYFTIIHVRNLYCLRNNIVKVEVEVLSNGDDLEMTSPKRERSTPIPEQLMLCSMYSSPQYGPTHGILIAAPVTNILNSYPRQSRDWLRYPKQLCKDRCVYAPWKRV